MSIQCYCVSRLVILSVWSAEAVTQVLRALTPHQSTEVRCAEWPEIFNTGDIFAGCVS